MNKTILLASFIFTERLDWFLGYLQKKFGIQKEHVFCYSNLDDATRLILTFRLSIPDSGINLKEFFPSAIIIHKKGDAIYTINALNKLIEKQLGVSVGNIDYKSILIDWSAYQNNLILIKDNELVILNIKRVF